jgi:hypothetical protein
VAKVFNVRNACAGDAKGKAHPTVSAKTKPAARQAKTPTYAFTGPGGAEWTLSKYFTKSKHGRPP